MLIRHNYTFITSFMCDIVFDKLDLNPCNTCFYILFCQVSSFWVHIRINQNICNVWFVMCKYLFMRRHKQFNSFLVGEGGRGVQFVSSSTSQLIIRFMCNLLFLSVGCPKWVVSCGNPTNKLRYLLKCHFYE